ncbi:MAG TPA: pirin family protein [Actinomycetota bacterium]|nr:pirin family protein [Actinomycetota bacterium]
MSVRTERGYVIVRPEDHVRLDASDFGMEGLIALESIGPFNTIQASGPLITVHDSIVEAGLGIGHHPHRSNERLFFIERGQLDHDDSLNRITGHMDEGDVGQFTEGRIGMWHSEWNHGDVDTRAYILVYTTDPIPEGAAFDVLKDAEAPRYEEEGGASTKELVGPTSRLQVHGDIRYFAESRLEAGGSVRMELKDDEGGLLSVRDGEVTLEGERLVHGTTVIWPPDGARTSELRSDLRARVVRAVHGPGQGVVAGTPMARRGP